MKGLAQRLFDRKYRENRMFLDPQKTKTFIEGLIRILYPQLNRSNIRDVEELEIKLLELKHSLRDIVSDLRLPSDRFDRDDICKAFFAQLETIEEKLDHDAKAICLGDPAAGNVEEVIFCYPGFYAICVYRVAHEFSKMGIPLFPRLLSEYAHQRTGVEIHPGAKIGDHFVIDHGTGIVIGETTEIGDRVKIYQGVTLGALSVEKSMSGSKRHPTIEDGCVIYSNATILGGETVIGRNSIIGGNVWITKSIAPHSLVYHKSEIRMKPAKNSDQ